MSNSLTPNVRARPGFGAILLTVLVAWLMTVPAAAEEGSPVDLINAEAARSPVTSQDLRGHVSVLMGSGGNIGVLHGADGQLLVDTGIAVSQTKLEAALSAIGHGPIRYAINTHWHWDHTDGNQWVHAAGATLVAHDNTVRYLATTTRVEEWRHTFAPVPMDARPSVAITTEQTMALDGEVIQIGYYGAAHTDGDLFVYFKHADVLFTGDTWWNGIYPFIDTGAGGTIDGMIRASNKNLSMTTDRTIIVPGHGPVGTRAQLIAFRDMLVGCRNGVAALKTRGWTLEQVVAADPTATFDAKWGGFVIGPPLFTQLLYRTL
jgi:glyoxylase-like metal-dependent hydrolase (beta-lactamase superfamily II)